MLKQLQKESTLDIPNIQSKSNIKLVVQKYRLKNADIFCFYMNGGR